MRLHSGVAEQHRARAVSGNGAPPGEGGSARPKGSFTSPDGGTLPEDAGAVNEDGGPVTVLPVPSHGSAIVFSPDDSLAVATNRDVGSGLGPEDDLPDRRDADRVRRSARCPWSPVRGRGRS